MGTVVLDSSVVIGVRDPQDAHHASAVKALRTNRADGHRLVLPCSALAEVMVGASRIGLPAIARVEAFVDAIIDDLHPIDRSTAKAAAAIRARHRSIRLPDALILAAGEVLSAHKVLTADGAWAAVHPRVDVIP